MAYNLNASPSHLLHRAQQIAANHSAAALKSAGHIPAPLLFGVNGNDMTNGFEWLLGGDRAWTLDVDVLLLAHPGESRTSVADALAESGGAVERGVAKLFRGKVTPFGSGGPRATQGAVLAAVAIVGLKSLVEHVRLVSLSRPGAVVLVGGGGGRTGVCVEGDWPPEPALRVWHALQACSSCSSTSRSCGRAC